MTSDDQTAAEWAFIFNVLGKERVREMMMYVAGYVDDEDEPDRRVIEVRAGDEGANALDITEHVEKLEDGIESEHGNRPGRRDEHVTTLNE